MEIFRLVKCICMIVVFFVCATVQHELGHILMGVALHFKLVYIEIFGLRIELYDKDNKLSLKPKINAKTCMYPVKVKYLDISLFLYYLGGIFLNLISAIIVWKVIKCNEIKLTIEIALTISLILALLPIKGTDLKNIMMLLNKEKRIYVLMHLYLLNNISPCNMPKKWFDWISKQECSVKNIYIQKMRYYCLLEEGTDIMTISKVFEKLCPLLMKTKYLKDRCEVLFYYAIIQKDKKEATKLRESIGDMIVRSSLSSKRRMLLTMEYLDKGKVEIGDFNSCNTDIAGIATLENKIIANFFEI